ncbi:MAG: hypothetical protein KDJ45_02920 [Hyphomicrobiaceae bacterium]|nr:hypothetical protein [Hyphomicrobiaceae bacterium]MCC0010974.1 hypothetical protein [Hyphomicrobiaceae bacterium]
MPLHPDLPSIPLLEVGPDFPMETLEREFDRANRLLDQATTIVPRRALASLDRVSRRWLQRWNNSHLPEIDRIASKLGRPGAYFLSVNYEWGCTCRVAPSPDGSSARLVRVLDWRTDGLGENVLAARVAGRVGPFLTMTWPGYTGVLQAVAPGRFAAALNQAPMRKALGYYYIDWAANRRRVWNMPHGTPAHLLRTVFERAENFRQAREMIANTPISTPAIFSLAGIKPDETCVIERRETTARVITGSQVAANHWQTIGWTGHARGNDSAGRACRMSGVPTSFDQKLSWLKEPILNPTTRLVMIADAKSGRFLVQGFEKDGAATQILQSVA